VSESKGKRRRRETDFLRENCLVPTDSERERERERESEEKVRVKMMEPTGKLKKS
jgi:hypothetical protein